MDLYYVSCTYFILGLLSFTESKIIINFRLYNYHNPDDILHNGKNCEYLYWIDHCDPIFTICITSRNKCDVLNFKIDPEKNIKEKNEVFSTIFNLNNMPNQLTIGVEVDDDDIWLKKDDHIGTFNSAFQIFEGYKRYDKEMTVNPPNLNIHLSISFTITCAEHYYGFTCDVFCVSNNNYKCDNKTGEKDCLLNCGNHEVCTWSNKNDLYTCSCKPGWTGHPCHLFNKFTKMSSTPDPTTQPVSTKTTEEKMIIFQKKYTQNASTKTTWEVNITEVYNQSRPETLNEFNKNNETLSNLTKTEYSMDAFQKKNTSNASTKTTWEVHITELYKQSRPKPLNEFNKNNVRNETLSNLTMPNKVWMALYFIMGIVLLILACIPIWIKKCRIKKSNNSNRNLSGYQQFDNDGFTSNLENNNETNENI